MRSLLGELGSPPGSLEELLHGCTVATNAILEGKGAPTALLTTRGFRDVLELRRVRVPELYEPLYERPPPLVPRQLRFEIDERTGPRGEVLHPLDEAGVRAAAERVRDAGIEVGRGLLPPLLCEPRPRAADGRDPPRETLPGAFVSLSVDVLPQKLEYERTSTTVINAYVGPPVERYVRSMVAQVEAGRDRRAAHGDAVERWHPRRGRGRREPRPHRRVRPRRGGHRRPALRGPRRVREPHHPRHGWHHRQGFAHRGGTGPLRRRVRGGRRNVVAERAHGGRGYALKLPVIDISEVGAGGGSLAWLDKAGSLKVGPESAGAVPGPACYDTGNDEPTVTDANVVLGYLNPEALAGGSVPVRSGRAHDAIASRLAAPLGRGVVETAFGVHTVANANMMKAVKAVTTYRGRDPRDFTLVAFGGSGGVHAVDLARVLQVEHVVLPVAAGVFSALGLLFSNLEMNETVPFLHLAADAPLDEAERRYAALAERIAAVVGGPREDIRFSRHADVRFAGQAYELTVPFGAAAEDGASGRSRKRSHRERWRGGGASRRRTPSPISAHASRPNTSPATVTPSPGSFRSRS